MSDEQLDIDADDMVLARQVYNLIRSGFGGRALGEETIAKALTDRRERTLDAVRDELEHYTTLDIGITRHWSEDAIERAVDTLRIVRP